MKPLPLAGALRIWIWRPTLTILKSICNSPFGEIAWARTPEEPLSSIVELMSGMIF